MSKHDDEYYEKQWVEFAKAALTGFCVNPRSRHPDDTAGDAILYADAMVAHMRERERDE